MVLVRVPLPIKPYGELREEATAWQLPPPLLAIAVTEDLWQRASEPPEDKFIQSITVVPWGVLGTRQIRQMSKSTRRAAPQPGASTVIVDPAGLHHIHGQQGPRGASGCAGDIYSWLGKSLGTSFPDEVKRGVRNLLDAKYHAYGAKRVIHVASPNLQHSKYCENRLAAVQDLSKAYCNCLREFACSSLPCLRLLPLSAGAFGGSFAPDMPEITREALTEGFRALETVHQKHILDSTSVVLCIFCKEDYEEYSMEFSDVDSSGIEDCESDASSHASSLSTACSSKNERRFSR